MAFRRFDPRTRTVGELLEGAEDATGVASGLDGFEGEPAGVMAPSGRTVPVYRPYRPQIAPPPPSAQWLANPGYAGEIIPASRSRAIANFNAWQNFHSQRTNSTSEWLASQGLFGPETKSALDVRERANEAKATARAAIVAATEAVTAAERDLVDAINSYLETGKGPLPTGLGVSTARQAVEGAEMVVGLVDQAASEAHQRWGRALRRADLTTALERCEALKGDQAVMAAQWLRAKVDPGPGPASDPLRWL